MLALDHLDTAAVAFTLFLDYQTSPDRHPESTRSLREVQASIMVPIGPESPATGPQIVVRSGGTRRGSAQLGSYSTGSPHDGENLALPSEVLDDHNVQP